MSARAFGRPRLALAAVLLGGSSGCWLVAGLEDRPVRETVSDAAQSDAADGPTTDARADARVDADVDAGRRCLSTTRFGAVERVAELSTTADETGVSLTQDQTVAYVAIGSLAAPSSSLSVATRGDASGAFGALTVLAGQPTGIVSGPGVTGNGRELFFARAELLDGGGRRAFDIYSSVPDSDAAAARIQSPVVVANVNAPDASIDDQAPFLPAAGSAMYFSSFASGTSRIYRSARGSSFGAPVPVPGLGTLATELGPVVTGDELTIYFTGATTTGAAANYDIYVATRDDALAAFSTPVIVPELSGSSLEFAAWSSADGCTIYFVSDRPGGAGGFDVYRAAKSP